MLMNRQKRSFALCAVYFLLHVVAHYSALWFEVTPAGMSVSIWYAPAGLALALLVLLGPRYAPVVFGANFAGSLLTGGAPDVWFSWLFPALITANYTATAWAVRRAVGTRLLPGGPRETTVFVLAILGSPLLLAFVAAVVARGATWPPAPEFWRAVFEWWIGDASGLLTVVPVAAVFIAPWLDGRRREERRREDSVADKVTTFASGALLLGSVVLVLAVPALREHHAFFLSFLPLVWVCLLHGMPGAVLATLLVTMTGLVGMRITGSTADFAYVFLLFEVAVAGVGLGLGSLVSRRQAAERALAQSQAQLDRVIAGAQTGLWDWDLAGERIETNDRLAALLGYPPSEIEPLQARWNDLVHPQDLVTEQAALAEHLAGRTELYEAQFRLRNKAGQWHWILSRGSVVQRDADGRPLRLSGLFVDIHDRKRAEAEIGRLFRIIEATPDCVFTTALDGTLLYANAALGQTWGPPPGGGAWSGRRLDDLFSEAVVQDLWRRMAPAALEAGVWQGEEDFALPGGRTLNAAVMVLSHRDEELDTAVLSFILRDLSEQKRAEADRMRHEREIMQVQKNESLSVLAGGIAHDFNNLMMSVVGSANLARLEVAEGSDLRESIDMIERAALRASGLCQQMLAYAGRNPVEFAEVELNALIDETLRLLEPGLSRKISIRMLPARPLPKVLAATTQAQQVVMNLVINAAHAIGEREGDITIRTEHRHFRAEELEPYRRGGERLRPGDYVVLAVADNGCGMSLAVMQRIFEPFYTTKFTGSGLGLAVVAGFVRAHRAGLRVESAPERGTTFTLLLPVQPLAAAKTPAAPREPKPAAWRGEGKLLLADDDSNLRRVLTLMLRNLGFEVLTAADGREAVDVFREHAQELRCVLLDITMPRMDGLEAHAIMNQLNAEVPVILVSGYSQKLSNLPPDAIHPAAVLAKPFDLETLCARLRSVVGKS